MLKLHIKSQYGFYHIPVILGVVSTNPRIHQLSVVVSEETNFDVKLHTKSQYGFYHISFCHLRSGFY